MRINYWDSKQRWFGSHCLGTVTGVVVKHISLQIAPFELLLENIRRSMSIVKCLYKEFV